MRESLAGDLLEIGLEIELEIELEIGLQIVAATGLFDELIFHDIGKRFRVE